MRRPTVYLDTSTIADAFDGGAAGSVRWKRDLRDFVEDVASQGTPVFSFIHVLELFQWNPPERVLERARWMDSFHAAWTKTGRPAEDEELRWWLETATGVDHHVPYSPISPSILATLSPPKTPEAAAALLAEPTVFGFMRNALSRRHELPPQTPLSSELFARLHFDRSNVPDGVAEPDVDRVTTQKFLKSLRDRGLALLEGGSIDHTAMSRAIESVLADSTSLPLNRLTHSAIHQVGKRITSQVDSGSAGFKSRYGSMAYDIQHLVGAAYCDLFTCDHRIDEAIGSYREVRGFARQLSMKRTGGREHFVRALRDQLDRRWEPANKALNPTVGRRRPPAG